MYTVDKFKKKKMCLKTLNVQQVRATSKTKMPPFNCAHEMLLNLW